MPCDHAILPTALPEAGMTLLVGMIAGCFVDLFSDEKGATCDHNANEHVTGNNHHCSNDDEDDDTVDCTNMAENLSLILSMCHLKKAPFLAHCVQCFAGHG